MQGGTIVAGVLKQEEAQRMIDALKKAANDREQAILAAKTKG